MSAPGRSLTGRVMLVLTLAAVLPAAAVGALASARARANLEREVARGDLALIRALGASLDGRLQAARRALDIAAGTWADERTVDDSAAQDLAATHRLVRRLRREVPLFAAISIHDVDGEPLAGDGIAVATDTGAHTFGGYIGDVVFVDRTPRVRLVTQARSRTGELVGNFVAELDLGFIAETLAQTRLGPGAELLVVDGDGVPVARSSGAQVIDAPSLRGVNPAVDLALATATEGTIEAHGTVAAYRNLLPYQSLRGVRWAIILEQPEREAYALARATTRDTVIAVVLAVLVALGVGVALATRLTRPLHALAERADVIADDADAAARGPRPPIRGPGEIGALAVRLEELARRLAERERLKDALARGDRLATIGTMSASIAHELNNPLTTVLGYARLLREDKDDTHPDATGLALIADESARMQQIVRALLDYARAGDADGDDLTVEPIDVNALVRRTALLLGPSLQTSGVALALELSEPLPAAQVDPRHVQQVFVNLAHNATQAMDRGGTLVIATALGPAAATVHVTFADTGPGVPAADRERIFDPFYTTKGAGAGTGLGLAVARHLLTRCGGSIRCEDRPSGNGAVFRVVLPIGR